MSSRDLLPTAAQMTEAPYDPLLEALIDFEEAARQLDLEDWIVQRLRHAEREVTVNMPLVRHDGQAVTVSGIRIQHNGSRGPTLGPVRFSPDAHISSLRATAMRMSWQCALADIPFGGAAGAIVADSQHLTEAELKLLFKDYINSLRDLIGPQHDVLALASGVNEQTAAWMLDAFARARGQLELGVVTGKPAVLGGLPAPRAAAGRGLFLLLLQASGRDRPNLVRVALQGCGSLGMAVARQLHEAGASVVAAADISGGLLLKQGIDIPALAAYTAKKGVLFGFPGADCGCNADVIECPCDVLILAATERQVTSGNAGRIQAPLVIEVADGGISRPAEKALLARGVRVIPDVLANVVGALVSYLEWKQNVTYTTLASAEIEAAIGSTVANAYQTAHDHARKHGLTLRQAANVIAVGKVASAVRLR